MCWQLFQYCLLIPLYGIPVARKYWFNATVFAIVILAQFNGKTENAYQYSVYSMNHTLFYVCLEPGAKKKLALDLLLLLTNLALTEKMLPLLIGVFLVYFVRGSFCGTTWWKNKRERTHKRKQRQLSSVEPIVLCAVLCSTLWLYKFVHAYKLAKTSCSLCVRVWVWVYGLLCCS